MVRVKPRLTGGLSSDKELTLGAGSFLDVGVCDMNLKKTGT